MTMVSSRTLTTANSLAPPLMKVALLWLFLIVFIIGAVDSLQQNSRNLSMRRFYHRRRKRAHEEKTIMSYGSLRLRKPPTSSKNPSASSAISMVSWSSSYGGTDENLGVSSDTTIADDVEMAKRLAIQVSKQLKTNDFSRAVQTIRSMVELLERIDSSAKHDFAAQVSELVEASVRRVTDGAFAKPHKGARARRRVEQGLEAMQLQLSSSDALIQPYDKIPRATLMAALRAVCNGTKRGRDGLVDESVVAETAFRILQRLVTGVGVREEVVSLSEKDFNLVLIAVVNVGRMDLARKIVTIQERTPNAPSLSPVAYSILIKAYGRRRDLHNVDMMLKHAKRNKVKADTVMLNSLIDAYVNCNELEQAESIFSLLLDLSDLGIRVRKRTDVLVSKRNRVDTFSLNTLLKGYAKKGALEKAKLLISLMKSTNLWDNIATNTIVSTAIKAKDFDFAVSMLTNHTVTVTTQKQASYPGAAIKDHPNVEAYTELLDAYGKSGSLDKAVGVIQTMKSRGVTPNEYTYTCLVSAFAASDNMDEAMRILKHMETSGMKPTVITYNAMISAIVRRADEQQEGGEPHDEAVNSCFNTLKYMTASKVLPNDVTLAELVNALTRCSPARVDEAKELVKRFVTEGIVSERNNKVGTSLIHACGAVSDLQGALEAFRAIKKPDIVSLNAFMDACIRCGHERIAFDTFDHYFASSPSSNRQSSPAMISTPDVISYSVLITALLKDQSSKGHAAALKLYRDMRSRSIMPDVKLVDTILASLVKDKRKRLIKQDLSFVYAVLRDAKLLDWLPGQFEKRQQAVQKLLAGRFGEMSLAASEFGPLLAMDDDELFRRKGWNKVDSGFRLWGDTVLEDKSSSSTSSSTSTDAFLESKGWNDVDSGFRLL